MCTRSYLQGACHRGSEFKLHTSIREEWNGKVSLVVPKCRLQVEIYRELEEEADSALPLTFHFLSLFSKAL